MTPTTFKTWMQVNGLSLYGTGQALGISRRQIAYYASGGKPVPLIVMLACAGYEKPTTEKSPPYGSDGDSSV